MNLTTYKNILSSSGGYLGQVRRDRSDIAFNQTFTADPGYKRVYILTKEGWKFEDAKYQRHASVSLANDAVDYYLQFRPKVHYPIGSYVIVPDDTSPEINLSGEELLNPFSQPTTRRTQWWIIVGRDEAEAYVRYMILKCDWEFKWIYQGKLMSCWACSRSANSYTSGVWADEYSKSLDNLSASWLPDTHHTYGENLEQLGLCDTRTIMHNQRFFYSNNDLDPKIYQVTKITDLNPQGIIKLSIKQTEYNPARDNLDLHVCDYYVNTGDIKVDDPSESDIYYPDDDKTSVITSLVLNDAGELVPASELNTILSVGVSSYYNVKFSDYGIDPEWRIKLVNDAGYTDEEVVYYEGLVKLAEFDNSVMYIKPGKAGSLKGKHFILSVCDQHGEYYSSIELEVAK